MTTLHTGCGREVHHGGCTCREGAEIAALKAEVARARVQPLPSNLDGYLAFRDMVCAALGLEPTWSSRPAEEIARLRAALAAGPAALRLALSGLNMSPSLVASILLAMEIGQRAALVVAAQDADKKGGG